MTTLTGVVVCSRAIALLLPVSNDKDDVTAVLQVSGG
jgi:hypothetical protein